MSVIGPRPLLVEYLPYYTKEEHHRHDVRPGLRSAFKLLATYFTFLIILSLRRKKKWILCSFYSS